MRFLTTRPAYGPASQGGVGMMHVRVIMTQAEAEVWGGGAGDRRPGSEVARDVMRVLGGRLRGEDLERVEAARNELSLRRALDGAGITFRYDSRHRYLILNA